METFAESHAQTGRAKKLRLDSTSSLRSEDACSLITPLRKDNGKAHIDIQKTVMNDENNNNAQLQPRRLRRIREDIDRTPIAIRVAKDCDSQTTPVAAANFAARPKNIFMDVAEEEPTTLNDSLIDINCDFKIPLGCAVASSPAEQRRINFDDLTLDDSGEEYEAAFGFARKFPSWSKPNRLKAQIRRQSFLNRRGRPPASRLFNCSKFNSILVVDTLFTSKPITVRNPLLLFPETDIAPQRRKDSVREEQRADDLNERCPA